MRLLGVLVIALALAAPAIAEDRLTSPYRDQMLTEIRGLTPKEISDLREARGMGLARAAELNGYPGPRHLLDAEREGQLHLSPDQVRTVTRLFDTMVSDAKRVGGLLLGEERDVEREFRAGTITEPDLRARLTRIAALQGELRMIHLRTHLEARVVLSRHQVERYNELRGYTAGPVGEHGHRHRE